MLVTVVHLMYEAIQWLRRWRSSLHCMQLMYKHLDYSSVVLQRLPDRTLPCNDLTSLIDGNRCATATSPTAHVLWTNGSQQLAVLPLQFQVNITDGWKSYNDLTSSPLLHYQDGCDEMHDNVDVVFNMTSSPAHSEVSPTAVQLKDFVKLIAWKSGQDQDQKLIAASCCRKNFESLLKSFITGATLRLDSDLHATLFSTVQFCACTSLTHDDDAKAKPSSLTAVTLPESLSAERRSAMRFKPPNIVIYCGKKDSSRLFAGVKSVLSQCVNTDQYVIYHLKHDQVKSTPWKDNTALLVIANDKVYDGVDQQFLQYFMRGGRLLSFGSEFDRLLVDRTTRLPALTGQLGLVTLNCDGDDNVSLIATKYCYSDGCESVLSDVTLTCLARDSGSCQPVIVEALCESSAGLAILSQEGPEDVLQQIPKVFCLENTA